MSVAISPTIVVEPAVAAADAPVTIRLQGLPPGRPVTVRAGREDDFGRTWRSEAVFTADERGEVDLATARPVTGSYAEPDAMGLFWSMRLPPDDASTVRGTKSGVGSNCVTFEAVVDGQVAATASIERRFLPDGVTRQEVREDGLVGVLFRPAGDGPFPAVVVLSGSGGGLNEPQAGLLAGHGLATLALAYFNAETLPDELREIPLEYFQTAFAWLRRQPGLVPTGRVGIVGTSRGGELVLLLGATFPDEVGAIVSYVPSHVVHGAVLRDALATASGEVPAAWTHRGRPLPSMQAGVKQPPDQALFVPRPLPLTPIFLHNLAHSTTLAEATIPVEQIDCPVLLVSGEADAMWPSYQMAEQVMARLAEHGFKHRHEHRHYPDAGHTISYPHEPTTVLAGVHPVRATDYAYGGEPSAVARARADSWPRVVAFLKDSLG